MLLLSAVCSAFLWILTIRILQQMNTAFCTFGFGRLNDSRYTVRINRFEELLRHCGAGE